MRDRFKLWAHYNFIGRNSERLKRMGQAPGILYEVGEPTKYEDVQEQDTDQQSLIVPEDASIGPPTMASRPPVSGSSLDRVNPLQFAAASPPPQQFAGASPPSGTANQDTVAGLAEVGLPLFPAFASKGGLASIKKKKKKSQQMVY